MTSSNHTNSAHFAPSSCALAVLSAAGLGVVIGAGVAASGGWAGGIGSDIGRAAISAAVLWGISTLAAMGVLIAATARRVDRLGMAILASSMTRMLLALFIGLPAFFVLNADGKTFWTCFLLAGLLALAAETVWALRQLTLITASSPASSAPGVGVAS